ncbi:putative mitochondrial protein [Cucumis melo var. makuwa]|uniref:Putative mitochondrial protein n=1 Tax=Cucumis melo var. makuwa TaxID=1194695 RepID=A0A5D3C964_CUCMM|nr:putative mitochondrial protein [Cucumis melo var. makuwa]
MPLNVFSITLLGEDTDDAEDDSSMNAFTTCFTEIDLEDDSECSKEDGNEELTIEELKMLRKEDTEARAIQKERIQDLMKENERLMSIISSLKLKLKEVQNDYDQTIKSVKMLNSGTENLDSILKSGQNSSHRYGLGFDASTSSLKSTFGIKFVPALRKAESKTTLTTTVGSPPAKSSERICYYCGRRVMEMINVMVNDFESTAIRTYDEDDETRNILEKSSTLPVEVPKVDDQADSTNINSKIISKEVIADNFELVPSAHVRKNHPSSSIIGDPSAEIITRKRENVDYSKMIVDLCYTSAIESSTIDVALKDEY